MRNSELNRQRQRLESLFKRTRSATSDDVEIQAHWAKYLCVLCAGFIENAYTEIYCGFIDSAASEPVAKYARKQISKTQNPKISKFLETSRDFKVDWAEQLEKYTGEEGRGDAIDSIMLNRHKIVHGGDSNSRITLVQLREWYLKSLEILDYLEQQVI